MIRASLDYRECHESLVCVVINLIMILLMRRIEEEVVSQAWIASDAPGSSVQASNRQHAHGRTNQGMPTMRQHSALRSEQADQSLVVGTTLVDAP